MRVRLAKKSRKPQRGGFTLIELLVVISIIAVLASLILPGVQNARETARRTQCMSNMRNVGLAAINYATTYNGALPPLFGEKDIFVDPTDLTARVPMPWTVHLLPFVDQSSLYEQLSTPSANYTGTHAQVGIPVFNCPSDLTSNQPGALSYVANAGYASVGAWNDAATEGTVQHRLGNYTWRYRAALATTGTTQVLAGTPEAAKLSAALGVFWPTNTDTIKTINPNPGTDLRTNLDSIRDGTTQTIMLSENVSNGDWLPQNLTVGNLGFVAIVPTNSTTRGIGMAPGFVGSSDFVFQGTGNNAEGRSKINNNLPAASGTAPRPSSMHPQAVNVVFCDGSAKNLSQSIADHIYVRLISPNGNMYGQAILDGNAF